MIIFRKQANRPGDEFLPYLQGLKKGALKHYIEDRLLNQINWFDLKSRRNRRKYMITVTLSIVMSALIPVITFTSTVVQGQDTLVYKIMITALGWGMTALSSISAFCRFRELWIQYRTQCELLKSILYQFFTGCGEFKNSAEPDKKLVELCEGCMKKEMGLWAAKVPKIDQFSSTGS